MKNTTLEFSRLLVIASCIALIITYSVNNFIFAAVSNLSFWLIKVILLALFIPSLLSRNLRAYQWLCFLILLYFIQAILDIFSSDTFIQGIVETFFIALLFCSAIFFVHGCQKKLKQEIKTQE